MATNAVTAYYAQLKGLLAKSDGKDKALALLQYAAMFTAGGEPGYALGVQKSLASARKPFRFFKVRIRACEAEERLAAPREEPAPFPWSDRSDVPNPFVSFLHGHPTSDLSSLFLHTPRSVTRSTARRDRRALTAQPTQGQGPRSSSPIRKSPPSTRPQGWQCTVLCSAPSCARSPRSFAPLDSTCDVQAPTPTRAGPLCATRAGDASAAQARHLGLDLIRLHLLSSQGASSLPVSLLCRSRRLV